MMAVNAERPSVQMMAVRHTRMKPTIQKTVKKTWNHQTSSKVLGAGATGTSFSATTTAIAELAGTMGSNASANTNRRVTLSKRVFRGV